MPRVRELVLTPHARERAKERLGEHINDEWLKQQLQGKYAYSTDRQIPIHYEGPGSRNQYQVRLAGIVFVLVVDRLQEYRGKEFRDDVFALVTLFWLDGETP